MTTSTRPNNIEIREIAHINPCVTYTDIGKWVGLSRERIRQLCGNRGNRANELRKLQRLEAIVCAECGKIKYRNKFYLAQKRKKGQTQFFCSSLCSSTHNIKLAQTKDMKQFGTLQRNLDIFTMVNQGICYLIIAKKYGISRYRVAAIVYRFRHGSYRKRSNKTEILKQGLEDAKQGKVSKINLSDL